MMMTLKMIMFLVGAMFLCHISTTNGATYVIDGIIDTTSFDDFGNETNSSNTTVPTMLPTMSPANNTNSSNTTVPTMLPTMSPANNTNSSNSTVPTMAPTLPGNYSNNTSTTTTTTSESNSSSTSAALFSTTPTTAENLAHVGSAILAATWIPFVIFAVLALFVSFTYVRYYQHKRNRECGSTMVAIFAIALSLMTLALLPADIQLASSQKLQQDGQYVLAGSAWSPNQNKAVTTLVRDAYWSFYAMLMLFAFVLIPLAYFFYEEKDEEAGTTTCQRIIGSLKYTVGFLVFMAILLCIGAFATNGDVEGCNVSLTEDFAKCSGAFAEQSLIQDQGANAISFTMGSLTVIGFICFSTYTAVGMITLPIKMIRSRGKSSREDKDDAQAELDLAREQRNSITAKYKNRSRKGMSAKDRNKLLNIKDRELTVERALKRVNDDESGVCAKMSTCCQPFAWLIGILFFLFSLFLAISIMMTSADKLIKLTTSYKLDWKTGYSQASASAFYPVDQLLTLTIAVFPIDFILTSCITYYFVICTMSGVRSLGVRFCHKLLFKIRPRRTVPQGLLFFAFILMFTMIAMNVVMVTVAPQYVRWGNQVYLQNATNGTIGVIEPIDLGNQVPCENGVLPMTTMNIDGEGYVAFGYFLTNSENTWETNCRTWIEQQQLPKGLVVNDTTPVTCYETLSPCLQTRMAALLSSFFYNFWFFGAIYYWFNWVFFLFFFISLIYYTCKHRKNIVQVMINDIQEDFDDSDDDMTPFKWSSKTSKA